MPISADKVQYIIEIAVSALETAENLRQTLNNIKSDARNLKSTGADNEEIRLELADSILSQIETGIQIDITEKDRQEIYQERVRFQMNFQKNRKRREAKRENRAEQREEQRAQVPPQTLSTKHEIERRFKWIEAHPGQNYPETEQDPPLQTDTSIDTYDPPKLMPRKKEATE